MTRAISWLEIGLGLLLIASSATLLVYDWFGAVYCSPEEFECASWAVLMVGFFLGGPTLVFGTVTRIFPRTFWYGQGLQVVFICYVVLIAVLP